jgi:predicted  nucleic acid-binding Zn-ribbon protein
MPNRVPDRIGIPSNLQEQLRLLYELQQIDAEILTQHNKLKLVPLKIKKADERFQIHRQNLQEKRAQLVDAGKAQRTQTAELEMEGEQRSKYQVQLREVKTNKEYQALDKEISFIKVKEAEIEDEILSAMLRIDQLNEELAQQQKEFDAEQEKNNAQKAQYEQEAKDLKTEIATWQGKRQDFLHQIDPGLMGQYQDRFKRYRTGLVSLVVENTCGSCHLTIPPQTLQEVRKYDQPIRCGSCKLILYIPPAAPDDAPAEEPAAD